MYNNYFPYQTQNGYPLPRTEVTRVNGRNGAEMYNIAPNSSVLLLDESGSLVWLVTTDGAGYKTISPYDITPHQQAQAPNISNLEARITKLEEIINGYSADITTAKQKCKPTVDTD